VSERSHEVAGTFIDHLDRFNGTVADYAAGIAAHVLRRWKQPRHRAWFARAMRATAELIADNLEGEDPALGAAEDDRAEAGRLGNDDPASLCRPARCSVS